jgi:hypothetical protein
VEEVVVRDCRQFAEDGIVPVLAIKRQAAS